ncbi:uncharacterized protein [Halyomorpha halys]|uniref:uncharacterized protein n=1 Tax=Halyomorpha halys TaxID=286706 RepID=UPI0006D4EA7E|nr:uncharacterized protein LOC106686792 [Halyomorpha halys]
MPLHTSCNIAKIDFGGFLLLKLCLVSFMAVDIAKAQNHSDSSFNTAESHHTKMNLTNNFSERGESNYLSFSQNMPFRMDFFLKSLKELEFQENHKIRKKKSVKRNEKMIEPNEMRDRIKNLMSNISRTLNDVDWYFSYEQLDDEKNRDKESFVSYPTQKIMIKRMKKVDDDISDAFVNSFVQQMYELDPSILDKIDERIDSEFSSDTDLSMDLDSSNVKRSARVASTPKARRTRINTAVVKEDYSYVDEVLTKIPNYLNGVNKVFKQKKISKLLSYDPDTTTTTEATTYENFYDYGDYYKESEEKLRDVAHYEIVQDVLHSTHAGNKDYEVDPYKVLIKTKNKKIRNFHKNKEILKKNLKNRLQNFQSKPYNDYNIDSDY